MLGEQELFVLLKRNLKLWGSDLLVILVTRWLKYNYKSQFL